MAITITKGYTFTTTEQVTSSKLHQLVDSATVSLAAVNQSYVVTMSSGDVIDITNSGTGDSIEINSSSTGCCIDLNKTGTGAGTCIDITNGGTGVGLDVNQTGNGTAVEIDNDGTAHGLYLHQDGDLGASNYGLYVYSNTAQADGQLVRILEDNASSTYRVVSIENDGTGDGLFVSLNGVLASGKYGLYVYSNVAQTASSIGRIENDNASSDQNTFVVVNDGTGIGINLDQNGNAIALNIDSEATAASAIQYDVTAGDGQASFTATHGGSFAFGIYRKDATNENCCIRLGSYYLWVDATGDLRIKSSAPASDTDGAVVGGQS